ncbi:hypothetical protein HDU91_005874 [Kappamyces sp. JEL0680]|nr:hypothetical protein HDU91_005874 [Kappamyces sp. JEL0680]
MSPRSQVKSVQTLASKIVTSLPPVPADLTRFPVFGQNLALLKELFQKIDGLTPALQAEIVKGLPSLFADHSSRDKVLSFPRQFQDAVVVFLSADLPKLLPVLNKLYESLPVSDQVEE